MVESVTYKDKNGNEIVFTRKDVIQAFNSNIEQLVKNKLIKGFLKGTEYNVVFENKKYGPKILLRCIAFNKNVTFGDFYSDDKLRQCFKDLNFEIKNKKEKEDAMQNNINYYWVNQGQEYPTNKDYIVAPYSNYEGHKIVKNIKVNDKILSYISEKGGIFRELTAISNSEKFLKENDDREWYRVKVAERFFSEPVSLQDIKSWNFDTSKIDENHIPWQKNYKKTKQSRYLTEISEYLYENIKNIAEQKTRGKKIMLDNKIEILEQPKNLILYGPPGTGKTYNTVVEAMKIIGSKEVNMKDEKGNFRKTYSSDEYKKLKEEFDKYKLEGRIKFVTFHQSYSYEEFVEGIKPDIQEWEDDSAEDIKYVGKNGLFKNISNNALFDIIEINNEKEKNELNFSTIMENFIEEYPIGTTIETTTNLKFKIVDYYKNKSIRVCPNGGISTFSVSWEPLQEMLEEYQKGEIKSPNELGIRMKGKYKSLATYYFPILKNLVDIAKKDDYQDEESKVKLSIDTLILDKEFKNKIIKNYYDKQLKLKLKDDINIKPYILIIDEINRGNISKIFGELITLIEEDKRLGEKHELTITLPYSQDTFGVPSNLYIIGTMNTSDRSIASVDIALRRRFKFKEMMPEQKLVKDLPITLSIKVKDKDNKEIKTNLKDIFETLNKRISALLDRDHQIGHSYFINVDSIDKLKQVWFDSVMPLLNEYFYGDWEKLQLILGEAQDENKYSFIEKFETDNIFAKCGSDISYDDNKYFDFRKESVFDNEKFLNALSHAFLNTIQLNPNKVKEPKQAQEEENAEK